MFKKIMVFVFWGFLLLNIYSCVALIAGTAGGAGTAVWLSGKLVQEFSSPYEHTITAAKNALKSLHLELTKETREDTVTQLRSKYTDGKSIWIDIRKITDTSSKVEVRVGTVGSNKEAANKVLTRIQQYL